MIELIVFLLPLAAASGWYTAARRYKHKSTHKPENRSGYFKGLNYLLNEQPEKAINVFVDMLEVDHETIETHLALGSLFRRRGEVEKAIRLHQNLIARPNLGHRDRLDVLYELGLDYTRAGLLDRAEALFAELEKQASHEQNAVSRLLEIYQQEREWEKAIEYAKKLAALRKKQNPRLLSQLFCELALKLKRKQDLGGAEISLKKALAADPECVRVNIIRAELALDQKDFKQALKFLLAIENQDVTFLPEVLQQIVVCYDALDRTDEKFEFLNHLKTDLKCHAAAPYLLRLIQQRDGHKQAMNFLQNCLQESPQLSDLVMYLELCDAQDQMPDTQILADSVSRLNRFEQRYQCQKCGHISKDMHWQCNRCQQWGLVKPYEPGSAVKTSD